MPDSPLLPFWGPAREERDLGALLSDETIDALLSGTAADIPAPLLPVKDTLDALRSATTRRELSGEATAMAAFRAAYPPSSPVREAAPEWYGAPLAAGISPWVAVTGAVEFEQRPVTPHTLVLPPAGHRPGHGRHRRRPAKPARRQAVVLLGVAATTVLGVAVGISLSGSVKQLPFGRPGVTTAAAAPHGSGGSVDGTGKREPTPKPTPSPTPSASAASPSPAELCQEFFGYAAQPGASGDAATEAAIGQQLSGAAGGTGQIIDYCHSYLPNNPYFDKIPGSPIGGKAGSSGTGQDDQGRAGDSGQGGGIGNGTEAHDGPFGAGEPGPEVARPGGF